MDLPSIEELTRENPGYLDEAVHPTEAARITDRSEWTLATLRSRGSGPRYLKLGRSIRYRRRDLFEWLAAHVREHTADDGRAA